MNAKIRVADEGDAAGMLEIYAPFVRDTEVSFETQPPSVADFKERILAILERRLWLVCDIEGDIAGYAYAGPFNARDSYIWSVELSVFIHPAYQRRGVGRGLYVSLLECLALQGFFTAVGRITLPNPGSVALHEGMGFSYVGVNERIGHKVGAWHDVGIWQSEIRPLPSDPEQPLPYDRIAHTAQWADALATGQAYLSA